MTNDCVSITKILVMGVELMTDRYKQNIHIKSKGQCNYKYAPQKKLIYFPAQQ